MAGITSSQEMYAYISPQETRRKPGTDQTASRFLFPHSETDLLFGVNKNSQSLARRRRHGFYVTSQGFFFYRPCSAGEMITARVHCTRFRVQLCGTADAVPCASSAEMLFGRRKGHHRRQGSLARVPNVMSHVLDEGMLSFR